MRTLALVLALPLCFLSAVEAAPKKKSTAPASAPASTMLPLEADLGKLKWGMSVEEVKAAFYDRLNESYKEQMKGIRDTVRVDELLAQQKKEKAAFEKSYVELKTDKDVGLYRVSIVSDEMKVGVGESMLVIDDERKSKRYLFFENGKFQRLYVSYNSDYLGTTTFDEFVARIGDKHGAYKKPYKREVRPREIQFIAASWSDSSADLWVEDKRDLYGSIVLIYTSPTARKVDHAATLGNIKTTDKYSTADSMIDNLDKSPGQPATPSKTEPGKTDGKTPTPTTKTDPKKDPKKKVFDPLEGTGL